MLPSVLKSWRVPTLQIPIKAFKDGLQLMSKDSVLSQIQRYLISDLQTGAIPRSQAVSVRPSSDVNLRAPEYVFFWEKLKKCFGFGSKKEAKGKGKSGKKKQSCKSGKGKCSKNKKKDTCSKKTDSNICGGKPDEKKKADCKPKAEKKSSKSDVKKATPCLKKEEPCKKKEEKKKEDPCKKKEEKKKEDPCKKKEEKKKEDPCKKKEEKKKEDPCKKKEEKKKEDPCKKKDEKKKEDPCKKKEEKKKEDPCKKKEEKKKEDPCKKKEEKKKEDPCKKKEQKKDDPCKKKDDKKKDDPCKKKEDPCKKKTEKKEDPCKKKDDKKKEDPCKKKDEKKADPCKKKEDPCKKKEDPCKKKEDPCKKKEDPCKKKEDPCKKKDPCGDKFVSNESFAADPILLFSISQPVHKKEEEIRGGCRDPCAQGACDVLPGQDEPCGSSVSWKMKVNPCSQRRSSSRKSRSASTTACIVDAKKKECETTETKKGPGCGITENPCGKKACPNRCEVKKNRKLSSVQQTFDLGIFNFMYVLAGQAVDILSLAVNFASQRGTPINPPPPSRNQQGVPGNTPAPGSVAQKVSGLIGKIKGFLNGPEEANPPKEKQQPKRTNMPISTPGRSTPRYPTKTRCEGLDSNSHSDFGLLEESSKLPELSTYSGFVFSTDPPKDDFQKCEDKTPPCPVDELPPCPKQIEPCDEDREGIWSDIDESYGYEKFPFKQEQTHGVPMEIASLRTDDPYANHKL